MRATVREPVTRAQLLSRALLSPAELDEGLAAVERAGDWLFARGWLEEVRAAAHERLAARAASAPLDPGLPVAELLPQEPWAAAVLPLLGLERRGAAAYLPGAAASLGEREEAAATTLAALAQAAPRAAKVDDRELARFLEQEDKLVRLGDGMAVSAEAYAAAKEAMLAECEAAGRITIARLRDLIGTGRRDAQLLLERFDADGLTRRIGDERVLRRAARGGV